MPRPITARLPLVLLFVAPALQAHTDESFAAEVQTIEILATPAGVTPAASAGRVGREEIEAKPTQRIADLLELIPGFIATQHSGEGKANQYFARGFNLDHGTDFAVSFEGVPLNLSSHGHGQGYLDLNFLIPELLEGYDYRKGPYSLADGDFGTAGSAELRLADGAEDAVTLGAGEYGSRTGLAAGSIDAAGGTLIAAAEHALDDGPWRLDQDLRATRGLLRFVHGSAEARTTVTAMGYDSRWTATDQVPRRAVEDGRIERFGFVDDGLDNRTHRYLLALRHERGSGPDTWTVNVWAQDYELDLFSNFTYFLDDPVAGDQFEQFDDRSMAGGSATLRRNLADPAIALALVASIETRYDRVHRVGLFRTQDRRRLSTVRDDSLDDWRLGGFVGLEARPLPWLRLTGGARVDRYAFDVSPRGDGAGVEGDEVQVSPKLSSVFGPWSGTELFINAGRGFHSNDARTAAGDPDFDALVSGTGYEAGLRVRPLHGMVASLALWTLELDSELVYVGDAGETEARSGSRRRGVEVSMRWHPRPWVGIDADWTATHARLRNAPGADRIPNAIPQAGRFAVALAPPRSFDAAMQVRHFRGAPLSEDGDITASDATRADVLLRWKVGRLTLRTELLNVFDVRDSDIEYAYESRLADEAEGVDDIHFHPALPRMLRASVRLAF